MWTTKKIKIPCLLLLLSLIGCSPNKRIVESSNENPEPPKLTSPVEPAVATFESDLQTMRTADFDFIYVFRRKDRGELDAEDKAFMSLFTADMNRRKVSDGGRVLIVGSNFQFPPENLKMMTERFDFEDYSKPESAIMNANSSSLE